MPLSTRVLDSVQEEVTEPLDLSVGPTTAGEEEDALVFALRAPTGDKSGRQVLEVVQVWGQTVVNTRHYSAGQVPVTLGSSFGTRARVLGHPVAWVPDWTRALNGLAGAMLSSIDVEWKSDFYVPSDSLPSDDFALFEWEGQRCLANLHEQWSGFLDQGETRWTLDELIASGRAMPRGGGLYQLPLDDDARLVVDVGGAIFSGQRVPAGKAVARKLSDGVDYPLLTVLAFMGLPALIFLILLQTTPIVPDTTTLELPASVVAVLLEKPQETPLPDKKSVATNEPAGEKAKAAEGKVGKEDAKVKTAKGDKVELKKREIDQEVAMNSGVLAALADGAADDVFGSTALSANLTTGIGSLIGANGTQIGTGGLGSRGGGLGGGGTAEGIGGTGGHGRHTGDGTYGSGGGEFGQKDDGPKAKFGGEPIILGALDKSLIDAVIRRNMSQIRYCYQMQLTRDPSLAGKITERFVINGTGAVSRAETVKSTMGNSAVESCINDRFMKFQFPEPKGGGIVIVSYPFLFAPG